MLSAKSVSKHFAVGALLAGSILAPCDLEAQHTVRGVLIDSLRPATPLAGEQVSVLGTNLRATTDSLGRFVFRNLPASSGTVTYSSARLDSLGLEPLYADFNAANDTAELVLATPSRSSYHRAVCGGELDPALTVLLGEMRTANGSPAPNVQVEAFWTDYDVVQGVLERRAFSSVDTTDDSGVYIICGVPEVAEFTIRAEGEGLNRSERQVRVWGAVGRHDLTVGPSGVVARITGRVLSEAGTGLGDAIVTLRSDTTISTRTRSDGSFDLAQVPVGSGDLTVRAIGFSVGTAIFDAIESNTSLPPVQLERAAQELSTVEITEDMFAHELRGFEERRGGAFGNFITEDELEKFPIISPTAVASLVPRLDVRGNRPEEFFLMRRGAGRCKPLIFSDGANVGRMDQPEDMIYLGQLVKEAKRIEVYAANHSPPKFTDFEGCGAIVIWSR